MKNLVISALTSASIIASTAIAIADPDEIRDAFWDSYYAAQNGYNSVQDDTGTEALINELRAQRGAPPCAIGLLRQAFMNRPAC